MVPSPSPLPISSESSTSLLSEDDIMISSTTSSSSSSSSGLESSGVLPLLLSIPSPDEDDTPLVMPDTDEALVIPPIPDGTDRM